MAIFQSLVLTALSGQVSAQVDATSGPAEGLIRSEWARPLSESVASFGGEAVAKEDVPATLALLASSLRENVERITTWQAVYSCEYEELFGRERVEAMVSDPTEATSAIYRHAGKIEFATDRTSRSVYTSFASLRDPVLLRASDRKPLPADLTTQWLHQRSVLSPETYLSCQPELHRGVNPTDKSPRSSSRVGFRDQRHLAEGERLLMAVNPWDMYGMYSPFHETFDVMRRAIVDRVAGLPENYVSVLQAGSRVRIDVREVDAGVASSAASVTSYFLDADSRFGGQMAAVVNYRADGSVEFAQDWTYKVTATDDVGTVLVPDQYRWASIQSDGQPKIHRTLRLESVTLNDTLAENVFTIQNLGLVEGDRFVDRLAGQEFLYTEQGLADVGTPLPDSEPNTDVPLGSAPANHRMWLVVSNFVVLMAIGLTVLVRRNRRPQAS